MTLVDARAGDAAGPALDFRLPRFQRIAWTSRAAQAAWAPRLETAAEASAAQALDTARCGAVSLALLRLAPFEAPLTRRGFREAGRQLAILEPGAPAGMIGLVATPRSRGLWCLAGEPGAVDAAEAAWNAGDAAGVAAGLGIPPCCAGALLSDNPFRRPEWAAMQGAGLSDWRTNHTLFRLGLSPAPWLPCRPDCPLTLAWLQGRGPVPDLAEILSWPLEWSALHGIAQVLTPVFRLVHDTVATGRKAQHVRGEAEARPAEAATGLVFPYKPPRRRRLDIRRTFRDGIAHIGQDTPAPKVAEVRRLAPGPIPRDLEEPALAAGAAAHWRAMTDWTESDLETSLRQASSAVSGISDTDVPAAAWPVAAAGPDLTADLRFPEAIQWLERDSPPLTLTLGEAGGGGLLTRQDLRKDACCALVRGRRRWVFCPPGSEIGLLDARPDLFAADIRDRLSRRGLDIRLCEQAAGDVVFIPRGWWRQVRNLDATFDAAVELAGPHALASRPQRP